MVTGHRLSLFDSPLFLGFDRFEETLDRIRKTGSDGYPPYNIEQLDENTLRISLAVAGFRLEDLDIEIEKNQLTVRGKREDDPNRVFLYRGIAARQFRKSFVLADGIEVLGAHMDDGLLHIDLKRRETNPDVQKIRIGKKPSLLPRPERKTDAED